MNRAKNTTNIAPKKIEIEKEKFDRYDFQTLFCPSCLQYPEYIIDIDDSGIISLIHICTNRKESKKKLSELKSCSLLTYQNACICCKTPAFNICLKCGKFFCEKCGNEHENNKGPLNTEYSEKSIMAINYVQYLCKEHFQNVTHYCKICKKNLCEKECLKEHRHINNESLYKFKYKKNPSRYKGPNPTLIDLAKLARGLHDCYLNGIALGRITLNLILNLSLMEQINNFINNNK